MVLHVKREEAREVEEYLPLQGKQQSGDDGGQKTWGGVSAVWVGPSEKLRGGKKSWDALMLGVEGTNMRGKLGPSEEKGPRKDVNNRLN